MAEDAKKTKCTVRDGSFVEPCWALDEVTCDNNPQPNRRGIVSWSFLNMKDTPPVYSMHLIGCKSGKHQKNGLVFNHCPFCGEDIRTEKSKQEGEK